MATSDDNSAWLTQRDPRLRDVTRLATDAFMTDPFYRWLCPDEHHRRVVLSSLMPTALARSAVAVAMDGESIGLVAVHDPERAPLGGPAVPWRALAHLAWRARTWSALGFYRRLVRTRPARPHVLIDVLAVAASARGRGVARRLLDPVLQAADARALVIHLETTNPANLDVYRRFGFVTTHTLSPRPVAAWAMQRAPR